MDSDEFFDADNEIEAASLTLMTSPSVSVPLEEEDPSDIEEDWELHEDNDTSGGGVHVVYAHNVHTHLSVHRSLASHQKHSIYPPVDYKT